MNINVRKLTIIKLLFIAQIIFSCSSSASPSLTPEQAEQQAEQRLYALKGYEKCGSYIYNRPNYSGDDCSEDQIKAWDKELSDLYFVYSHLVDKTDKIIINGKPLHQEIGIPVSDISWERFRENCKKASYTTKIEKLKDKDNEGYLAALVLIGYDFSEFMLKTTMMYDKESEIGGGIKIYSWGMSESVTIPGDYTVSRKKETILSKDGLTVTKTPSRTITSSVSMVIFVDSNNKIIKLNLSDSKKLGIN